MTKGFIIAIDGPVAAGKGTIASLLAKKLNGFYLYTGATYRCVALFCMEEGIFLDDEEAVVAALPKIVIDLTGEKVFLNKRDVTDRIKESDVAAGSSKVAAIARVREAMVKRQREIVDNRVKEQQAVVSEGRDTGIVVFPHAEIKFFLTASPEVRIARRLKQLQNQGDTVSTFSSLVEKITERDKRDLTREADPLVSDPKAIGYIVVDNSSFDEEQTLEFLIEKIKEKGLIS